MTVKLASAKVSRAARNASIDAASADIKSDADRLNDAFVSTASAAASETPIPDAETLSRRMESAGVDSATAHLYGRDLAAAAATLAAAAGRTDAQIDADTIVGAASGATLQEIISGPTPNVPVLPTPGANGATFANVQLRLATLIESQTRSFLGYYIARGDLAREGINIKVARSTDKSTRASNRSSAIDALEATAKGAYDPSVEPKPRIDVWVTLSALSELFPNVVRLGSVKVALKLANCITRIDPPARWDDVDRYELKRSYPADQVSALIERTIVENLTADDVAYAMEQIAGRIVADPAKPDSDPIASADQAAARIFKAITDGDIDGARFILTLQTSLVAYGYEMVPSHDDRGIQCYKLIRTNRIKATDPETKPS